MKKPVIWSAIRFDFKDGLWHSSSVLAPACTEKEAADLMLAEGRVRLSPLCEMYIITEAHMDYMRDANCPLTREYNDASIWDSMTHAEKDHWVRVSTRPSECDGDRYPATYRLLRRRA